MFRKKNIQITLPQSCHENWNEMSPTEKGKFCQNCQKEVIDFTNMSDTEVLRIAKEDKFNLCGSFLESQLNRNLVIHPKEKIFNYKKIAAGIVALLSFKFSMAQSFHKQKPEIFTLAQNNLKRDNLIKASKKEYVISGTISLAITDTKELSKVTIKIGNNNVVYYPDTSGKFNIVLSEDDISKYTIVSFHHPLLKTEVRSIHRKAFPCILNIRLDFPQSRRLSGAPRF